MSRTVVTKTIAAPVERVFAIIADVRNFAKAVPDVVCIELLSEVAEGRGTRFRETRRMGGREATTELEITEFVANERLRFVADSHGAVWDSLYTVRPSGGGTELRLEMEGRPHTLAAKLMAPMLKPVLSKALEKDMDAVKTYCESGPAGDRA